MCIIYVFPGTILYTEALVTLEVFGSGELLQGTSPTYQAEEADKLPPSS